MFTCTSANVVYIIRCSRCGLLYIGETKRRLGDCFVEHLRSVLNKRQHLPVAKHFNSPSHSLDNMSILGLLHATTMPLGNWRSSTSYSALEAYNPMVS
eukprot:g10930.t1